MFQEKQEESVGAGVNTEPSATVSEVNAVKVESSTNVTEQTKTTATQVTVTSEEKLFGLISYLPFFGILTLILKPSSSFIKLHARQGILMSFLFVFMLVLLGLVASFGVIGILLVFIVTLAIFGLIALGVYSMYLALSGVWWKVPFLGDAAAYIPVELFTVVVKEAIVDNVNTVVENVKNNNSNNK